MSIQWKKNKKLNPTIILDKINSIRKVNTDGSISYEAFSSIDAETALFTMLEFNINIPDIVKNRIFNTAKRNIKHSALTKENFLYELNQELKKYLATKEKEFFLLTSISLAKPYPFKKIEFNHCSIRILDNYPRKYSSRNNFDKRWHLQDNHTPNEYAKVIIKVKAKSAYEASEKALDTLDILRSKLCLILNPGLSITFGNNTKPINIILLGGLHTLHEIDGKLAVDNFWYEPNYMKVKPFVIKNIKDKRKSFKWLLQKLTNHHFKKELEYALLQYVRSFDEKDYHNVIIKGWTAIEKLVAKNTNNYDLIPKRISFLFEEVQYHKQILEHLREYRNINVHTGEKHYDISTHCYQLQRYFFQLIIFYLNNNFKTLDKANSFLDLSTDLDTLKEKKSFIEKAINFRQSD